MLIIVFSIKGYQDQREASTSPFTVPKSIHVGNAGKGYGVYLAQRQLEEIEDQSYKSPTKLIRNLLTVHWHDPPLNKDITQACFSK